MTVEIGVVISVVMCVATLLFNSLSLRRSNKAEDKQEATAFAMVAAKLESIGEGISEIRSELKSTNGDVRELRDMAIKTDQSVKAAWRAIDDLREKDK